MPLDCRAIDRLMQKLLSTALAATGFALASCQQPPPEAPQTNAVEPEAPAPRLPAIERPMERAGLLQAVATAASATGLGRDTVEDQRKLEGRTFEVRIRFGCAGSGTGTGEAGPFGVRFDEEARTLRVRAAPDLTIGDPALVKLAGEGIDAVEGFWMRRPWLLTDGCPVASAPAHAASPLSEQRVGLAQFFGSSDSRTGQRKGRAYESTSTLREGETPSLQGYNLVLAGRLKKLGSGRVINCRVTGRDAPPECIVSAEFDHVWMEHPQTRAILAEWNS